VFSGRDKDDNPVTRPVPTPVFHRWARIHEIKLSPLLILQAPLLAEYFSAKGGGPPQCNPCTPGHQRSSSLLYVWRVMFLHSRSQVSPPYFTNLLAAPILALAPTLQQFPRLCHCLDNFPVFSVFSFLFEETTLSFPSYSVIFSLSFFPPRQSTRLRSASTAIQSSWSAF